MISLGVGVIQWDRASGKGLFECVLLRCITTLYTLMVALQMKIVQKLAFRGKTLEGGFSRYAMQTEVLVSLFKFDTLKATANHDFLCNHKSIKPLQFSTLVPAHIFSCQIGVRKSHQHEAPILAVLYFNLL